MAKTVYSERAESRYARYRGSCKKPLIALIIASVSAPIAAAAHIECFAALSVGAFIVTVAALIVAAWEMRKIDRRLKGSKESDRRKALADVSNATMKAILTMKTISFVVYFLMLAVFAFLAAKASVAGEFPLALGFFVMIAVCAVPVLVRFDKRNDVEYQMSKYKHILITKEEDRPFGRHQVVNGTDSHARDGIIDDASRATEAQADDSGNNGFDSLDIAFVICVAVILLFSTIAMFWAMHTIVLADSEPATAFATCGGAMVLLGSIFGGDVVPLVAAVVLLTIVERACVEAGEYPDVDGCAVFETKSGDADIQGAEETVPNEADIRTGEPPVSLETRLSELAAASSGSPCSVMFARAVSQLEEAMSKKAFVESVAGKNGEVLDVSACLAARIRENVSIIAGSAIIAPDGIVTAYEAVGMRVMVETNDELLEQFDALADALMRNKVRDAMDESAEVKEKVIEIVNSLESYEF